MSIVAASGQKLTVQPASIPQQKAVKQSKGNVKAATVSVDRHHAYVFAQRGDESGAGFVVINNESAPRSFGFDFTFDGRPAEVVVASDGSAVVMDGSGRVVNHIAAHARGECIRLAPAPIGAMAFRYTGGYCR